MTSKWVRWNLRFALVFNVLALVVSFVAPYQVASGVPLLYLYTPWLFPGTFAMPLLAAVVFLTMALSL